MTTLTATPDPTTGTVLLDVEQTILRDIFSRVVANDWGNATTGQAWGQGGGAAAEYAVNGTQGTMTFSTTVTSRRMSANMGTVDMGFGIQCTIAVAALTQPIQPSVMIRHTDGNNYYFAELSLTPSGAAELRIRKMVLGVTSTISGPFTLSQTHAPGATWNIVADICGTTIRAKAWRSTVSEPNWILTVQDWDLTTGSNAGARSVLASGNTNGSTVFAYDNAYSYISQPLRVFRVVSGVATLVRGTPIYTFPPQATPPSAIATLWDGEAPFDVSLTYQLRSACNDAVVLTSSPVTLLSNGNGWIRDPVNPSNNVVVSFSDKAFNHCDGITELAFNRWEPRTYTNASGVFDVINNERPVTVSMIRKRHDGTFIFTSKTLDDVDSLEALFRPGSILLVTLPPIYGFGRPTGTDYITVLDVQASQVVEGDYTNPNREWEIPYRLSYAPTDTSSGNTGSNEIGGGGATYADLAASVLGTTYATLAASGETYQQVAQGVGY